MKVLYIEDSEDNVDMMQQIVPHFGHDLVVAMTGQKGVEIIHQDNSFKLVMVDMQLPDIDGLTVIRQIHQNLPDLPIVAFTAFAMPDDKKACLEAGCTAYLTKPFMVETIKDLLHRYG